MSGVGWERRCVESSPSFLRCPIPLMREAYTYRRSHLARTSRLSLEGRFVRQRTGPFFFARWPFNSVRSRRRAVFVRAVPPRQRLWGETVTSRTGRAFEAAPWVTSSSEGGRWSPLLGPTRFEQSFDADRTSRSQHGHTAALARHATRQAQQAARLRSLEQKTRAGRSTFWVQDF